ncbi:hypothetical protein R5R35_005944 [Gryllus longicercus]|uniref:isoleucine--tRNA ligase n=1 Tax=Gryllus longicercus TaxID=2509291 RepID=A0AAN9V512_9ORTH
MLKNIGQMRKPLFSTSYFRKVASRCQCGVVEIPQKNLSPKQKFTHTVLLPKTSFPLRVNAAKRVESDNYIYETCKFAELYQWQREHLRGPEFVLHDGPPYANGKLHMGHAINKILKDITIRQKLLQGFRIHYVPGWDCHGLPIELKAITEENEIVKSDPLEIRSKAREIVKKAINDQLEAFKAWGVMANWNECYFTLNIDYIKNQLNQFLILYNKGLIYRDLKPIFWSPSSRTALAEAELEYNPQHVSKSVILGLHIVQSPNLQVPAEAASDKIKALVWTTTPWTLPANQAVCFNPSISYCLGKIEGFDGQIYLLAEECVAAVEMKLGKQLQILKTFSGELLKNVQYCHPVNVNKQLPFLPGSHVTSEIGTGLVHTAPAHGPDDFVIALQHQIPLVNLVDENGCYTVEAGTDLEGLSVLKEGNTKVLEKLKSHIIHLENYVHSYPCDWRTKQPVIVKASYQWFIDTDALKAKALELLKDITVYPSQPQSHSALISQIEKRPYWCISRQRIWGAPIPVLYKKMDGTPVVSRALIDHYNKLLEENGADFWWVLPKEKIAPDYLLEDHGISSSDVEKGKDILDIWFDSGLSWSYVLGNEKVADMYLEGVDQYTGWFQSSLMISVGLRGKTPYKSLFVHGFAVDEKGHKMSKSIGNVIDPEEIRKGKGGKDVKKKSAFGTDTLRWWVASHASQVDNVPVSQSIMEASSAEVHKIRIVLRFLLGALSDYSSSNDSHSFRNFFSLDLWMLDKLRKFETEIFESYNLYQYKRVCKIITNFITNEVSAIYCHITKDRLYCRKKDDVYRQSCQFVIKNILETVSRGVAPVLPYLIEEVYLHYPCKAVEQFFYSKSHPKIPEHWHFPDAVSRVETALKAKAVIDKMSSCNTLQLSAIVTGSGNEFLNLKELADHNELNELLQVSHSEVMEGTSALQIKIEPTSGKLCVRCRQYTSQFEDKLCHRCEEVLKEVAL